MARATVVTQMDGCWFHSRQKECSYPSKKTVCQSDPWWQRYKLVKCVTGSGRVEPCRAAHTQFCQLFTKEIRSALRAPLVITSLIHTIIAKEIYSASLLGNDRRSRQKSLVTQIHSTETGVVFEKRFITRLAPTTLSTLQNSILH